MLCVVCMHLLPELYLHLVRTENPPPRFLTQKTRFYQMGGGVRFGLGVYWKELGFLGGAGKVWGVFLWEGMGIFLVSVGGV